MMKWKIMCPQSTSPAVEKLSWRASNYCNEMKLTNISELKMFLRLETLAEAEIQNKIAQILFQST